MILHVISNFSYSFVFVTYNLYFDANYDTSCVPDCLSSAPGPVPNDKSSSGVMTSASITPLFFAAVQFML